MRLIFNLRVGTL
jgi:hypothetical protein